MSNIKTLRLSLKTQWFEMTKAGIKTEDYREMSEYWVNRFVYHRESKLTIKEIVNFIKYHNYYGYVDVPIIFTYHDLFLRRFEYNVMTLGYPKLTDTSRILKLEHKGIEIRTGNSEWGAEPGELYFVIKHGEIIND